MTNTKNKPLIMGVLVFLLSMDSYAWQAPQRWQSVGPKGVAIESEYSFKMTAGNPDTIYLRTGSNFIKTIDGGMHWRVEQDLRLSFFDELVIDPINPQVLFSMGMYRVPKSSGMASLFRSLDSGRHWDYYKSPHFGDSHVSAFFMLNHVGFPQLITESHKGTNNSILISNDGGENWSPINDSLGTDIRIMTVDSHNFDVMYGKTYHWSITPKSVERLHKSIDAGKTWVEVAAAQGISLKKLQIHPADSNLLFATIQTGTITFIARSQDGGKTWIVMEAPKNDYLFDNIRLNEEDVSTLYAEVHTPSQEDSEIVIAKSIDGGDNWSIKSTGFYAYNDVPKWATAPTPITLIVHPKNNQSLFLATSSHGILRSTNGGEDWQVNKIGVRKVGGQLEVAKNDSSLMYLASGAGHYKSVNAGADWEKFDVNQPNELCRTFSINPSIHSEVLCLAVDKMYKSTDAGNHWVLINKFDTTTLQVTDEHPSISYSSDGRVIYANYVNGVSKSTDSGLTWAKTNISQAEHIVRWLAADPVKPNVVYALIDEPSAEKRALYKSTDKGIHWEKKVSNRYFRLAMDPTRSGRFIRWGRGGQHDYMIVSLSEDGGDSWRDLDTPQDYSHGGMTISFNPKNPKGLFLLNWRGVFETADLESWTWTLIKKGFNGSFSVSPDDMYLASPDSILRLENFVMSKEAKDCLFTWAEQKYPQLFSPVAAQTQVSEDYSYRYYSQSNAYLGFFQDKSIHLLQPSVSGSIQDVGVIETYQNISACH